MSVIPVPADSTAQRHGREVERVFELMLAEIIAGTLAPGMKLNEAELARRMDANRGPIREAIRRLEGRGLVVCKPNAGARVIRHSPKEVLDTYAMRESVEGFAARLAAKNMSEAEIDGLRETTRLSRAGDLDQASFHLQIVRGSGNYAIRKLLNDEFYQLLKLWRTNFPWLRHADARSWFDHDRITEAIAYRDGDSAELLMRNHLKRLGEVILQNLREAGGPEAQP
ncbi:GntR family transcriptional regulator [Pigmentiphaga soli]|uniref:GntR family transcriptional regulator n=1 Tax=Pigmentiphaga soli TaxID=1007095 RepID=A0ABP8GV72_9BURK